MEAPNRAEELIGRIRQQATERAQAAMLWPVAAQTLTLIALLVLFLHGAALLDYALLIMASLATSAGATVLAMWRMDAIVRRAIGEAAVVYAIYPRVVTFEVYDWHIVGVE